MIDRIDAMEAAAAGLPAVERLFTAIAVGKLWHWKENNGVEDLRTAVKYIEHMIDREERMHG